MKKTDIAMIVFIASISILIAYFTAKAVFGDVYNGSAKVKTIDSIELQIVDLSSDVFNEKSINPTIKVVVSDTK
jgi:hypothetical protein